MDVHVGEFSSTIRATDDNALLNPRVLDQITRFVLQRLRDEQGHEGRADAESELRSGVLGGDTEFRWS
jgi:hypothetical protein